jgi:hypothetical protein
MLENWYNLKKEFTQIEFYKCILGAEQHSYKSNIATDLEELNISDVDELTLYLYDELETIFPLEYCPSCGKKIVVYDK